MPRVSINNVACTVIKGYAALVGSGRMGWPEAVRRSIVRPTFPHAGWHEKDVPAIVDAIARELASRAKRRDLTRVASGGMRRKALPAQGKRIKYADKGGS